MKVEMRYPGGRKKALTLSYDDNVEQDFKLIEIMTKYGLKGTFNMNSGCFAQEDNVYEEGRIHRPMKKSQAADLYIKNGMEVAVHGLTHPWPNRIPNNLWTFEIAEDRKNLEEIFGVIVRGCAYPFGCFTDDNVNILRYNGIAYARTVHSTHNFEIPQDWLRLDPTCHHDDEQLFDLAKKFVEEDVQPWQAPWLFYLWGHSYEFEANNNWERIERFAGEVSGRDDIWYATNIEIYDYVQAYRSLIFSNDMTLIYNPSAITVEIDANGTAYTIKPGETVKLPKTNTGW